MMKWMFLFFVSAAISKIAPAQNIMDRFSYYDGQWKTAPMKKGAFMQRVRKLNDTTYLQTTYNTPGPRISQIRSKDDAGKTLHGLCIYYHPNGFLDSAGEYKNGFMNGSWYSYDNEGNPFRRKDYDNGRFIKDTLFTLPSQDSLRRVVPAPGEVESTFKGGIQGWTNFLTANFIYPPQAQKSDIEGMVVLQFKIDEKGKVRDPEINRSVDYTLDEEALRIINRSPAWIAASKDGKAVVSYKRQPVIFRLTGK